MKLSSLIYKGKTPSPLGKLCLAVIGIVGLFVSIPNTFTLIKTIKGTNNTPQYDNRWWVEPVTHLALMCHPHKTFWEENADHSQKWMMQETLFCGKAFRTVLENHDLEPVNSSAGVRHSGASVKK
jgi:hypothetical protein